TKGENNVKTVYKLVAILAVAVMALTGTMLPSSAGTAHADGNGYLAKNNCYYVYKGKQWQPQYCLKIINRYQAYLDVPTGNQWKRVGTLDWRNRTFVYLYTTSYTLASNRNTNTKWIYTTSGWMRLDQYQAA